MKADYNLKRYVFVLPLLIILFCQSCTTHDLDPRRVLLSVTIEPGHFPSDYDVWIFISDRNGRTLDVRHAKDSSSIHLSGGANETVTLNVFVQVPFPSSSGTGVWNSFGIQSYQHIPAGSSLQLKAWSASSSPYPDTIGIAHFILQDFDDSDSPFYSVAITDGLAGLYSVTDPASVTYSNKIFTSKMFVRKNPSRFLATAYHNNMPMYLWLNNVAPGDSVNVSFNDFAPCKTIPINKQVYTGDIRTMSGSNIDRTYMFSNLNSRQFSKSSDLSKLPTLGYLEGFDKYFINVVDKPLDATENLYYAKAGTVPQSINLPDYNFSVVNPNLYGLALNFSNEYSYKEAYFIKSNSTMQVNWTLYAPAGDEFKAPSIPSEIVTRYPMLNLDGLKLETGAYTHCLDGYTYVDYVAAQLALSPRDVYEELRYIVYVK